MATKKLVRSATDRMIAGVCGGLGEFFDVDATLFRLIFVVLVIFGGAGVLIYIVLWIIVPESGEQKQKSAEERFEKFGKEVEGYVHTMADSMKEGGSSSIDVASQKRRILLAAVLIIVGVAFVVNNFIPNWNIWRLWPAMIIILGIWLLWQAQPRSQSNNETDDVGDEQKEESKSDDRLRPPLDNPEKEKSSKEKK